MQVEQHRPDLALFLASSAHDMKNSVGMLSGTLENLLANTSDKLAPAYQQMAHMLYETRRLNNNLIQLLALYKVGGAAYPFDQQPLLAAQFLEEIVAYNQVLFDSKNIRFESECAPDLIWCFDEDLVRGVLGHALNNAIRYCRDQIRLRINVTGDFLEIRVEDNGAGYPTAMLEAGVTAASGIDFTSGSTGLGLYFSSEVAKMHLHRGRVGSVALENSGIAGGGCFILRLP